MSVTSHCSARPRLFGKRLRNPLRCRQINIGQHDSCPALREHSGGGGTQPAAGSGNQHDFVRE